MYFALLVLTIGASLSPLLTFVWLWQLKEWRTDRLIEHLNMEGWVRQLFGRIRLAAVSAYALLFIVWVVILPRLNSDMDVFIAGQTFVIMQVTLALLFLISIVNIFRKSQRRPVWTMKALMITTAALALTGLTTWALLIFSFLFLLLLPFIVLLQPLFILIAWLLFRPVDVIAKQRILAKAKNIRRSHPNLTVIGITGSVGKTTMKELLAHLLAEKKPIATPAHVNSEMGVAQWLIGKLKSEPADSRRILIVEMGAYRIGEIKLLCEIAQPTIGVITYVGKQHLSLFGSPENIVQAKGELFEMLPTTGHAFANRDNVACDALLKRATCPVTTVGTDHRAAVRALDIEETGKGLRFRAFDTTFDSPLPGTHSLVGTLIAISVAKFLGIKPTDIAQRLKSFRPPERTFEVKEIGMTTVLDDSYNSSPDSVRAAIAWAAGQTKQPKILLMEGIIELGEAEEHIHRELAAEAARVFDEIYVTHPRYLPYCKDAFGSRARIASEGSTVNDGSLLVLSGRLSEASKHRFLPSS